MSLCLPSTTLRRTRARNVARFVIILMVLMVRLMTWKTRAAVHLNLSKVLMGMLRNLRVYLRPLHVCRFLNLRLFLVNLRVISHQSIPCPEDLGRGSTGV